MAQTHKHLGTSRPAAATNTTVYTATAVKAILSSIFVCNTAIVDDYIRIFRVASAGAASVSNALYYDLLIRATDTLLVNGVPVLESGDFLVVYSLNGTSTFTVAGMEIS